MIFDLTEEQRAILFDCIDEKLAGIYVDIREPTIDGCWRKKLVEHSYKLNELEEIFQEQIKE